MPQNSLDNLFYLTSKDLIQARQKYHDIEILTIVDPKYKKNRMEVLNLAYSDLEHAYISWLNCFEIGCYLYFKKEIDQKFFYEMRREEIRDFFEQNSQTYSRWINPDKEEIYNNIKKFYQLILSNENDSK